MSVSVEDRDGLQSVVITGERLRVVVLPEVGAKIISVVHLPSGRELVWQDPARPVRRVRPGSAYGDNDASGIDDCFPSVDPCCYPRGVPVEDHGMLWSRPWRWWRDGPAVTFEPITESAPFVFRRRLTVRDQVLRLDYELTATGSESVVYNWTGHPLLRADPGTVIELPDGLQARTGFATGGRLDTGDPVWTWPSAPLAAGGTGDVSVVQGNAGLNEKYWFRTPAGGCRLRSADGSGTVVVDCDASALPWLAVCVNDRGWPARSPARWVAVEPSTGRIDALDAAAAAGDVRTLPVGQTDRWWWSLSHETDDRPRTDGSE